MNREDIIRMARETGLEQDGDHFFSPGHEEIDVHIADLERFAALVAAAEREKEKERQRYDIHSCGPDCDRYICVAVRNEREATNNAYRERNQLVALLSTLFPSGKAKTAIEGWDESWHGCVYIDFPWGQASWHYHTDDEWLFAHLSSYTKPWDGHTTEAKYAAITAAIRARGQ